MNDYGHTRGWGHITLRSAEAAEAAARALDGKEVLGRTIQAREENRQRPTAPNMSLGGARRRE